MAFKSKKIAFAAGALALALALPGCRAQAAKCETRVVTVMSTVATISVYGEECAEACDALTARLAEFEAATSRFIEGSDVSRVSAAAGISEVEIGGDCYAVLSAAREYAAESGGSFNVCIGALTSLWGIGADNPRVPREGEIAAALALVDAGDLTLRESGGRFYAKLAREGESLDLGGCAKGYALDLCREELAKYDIEYGFVSLGGNVMLAGDKGGDGFKVGVRYPEQGSEGSICILKLSDTCVATTGAYERFFEADGVSYHHVLDPATGYPAVSDLLSASAVCRDGLRGDYLSTRLFMLGKEGALALMRSGEVEAVLVGEDNKVYISRSLESAFASDSAQGGYTFEFV